MTVYKILPDYVNFTAFMLPMKDLIRGLGKEIKPANLMHFYRHNLSLAKYWKDITATFEPVDGVTRGNDAPDVSTWVSGTLVLSDTAKSLLSILKDYGEFLPVDTDGGQYWVLNCTTVVAADESNSSRVIESGQVLDVDEIVFDNSALEGKLLFKTEFDGFRNLYCTDEFRHQVDSNGLSGLLFSKKLAGAFE